MSSAVRVAGIHVAAVALALLVTAPALAARTVVVVRHAEKLDPAAKDPILSAAGTARAQALAKLLARAGVTHVFTTDLARTKLTAEPLAAQAKLTASVLPAGDTTALLKRLGELPDGSVALVVGHSNTVPAVVKGLAGKDVVVSDEEYGRVFVVVGTTVVELAY